MMIWISKDIYTIQQVAVLQNYATSHSLLFVKSMLLLVPRTNQKIYGSLVFIKFENISNTRLSRA